MAFFQNAALLISAVPAAPGDLRSTPFYQTTAFINSAIFILLVVGSGFIGHWLAKAIRAADYGTKFGIIMFAHSGQPGGGLPRLAAEARRRPRRRIDPGL